MKNYFEHDIEVRFYDEILAQSKEWDWYIKEVENEFEGYNQAAKTGGDFTNSYRDLADVYV